uniref:Calcium binding and coiled-coil domain 1a n=1 Tax=Neogobius melanostomus TaxID=47308 RepID=A0A8C6WMM6_9GOBI
MENTWPVEFRNISCSYFPESRIDCHYSVRSQHTWASTDWIGLFKLGWSSLKDYYTFVWALAPNEGFEEGAEFNCCVQFQASYLPRASPQQYEFVYVTAKGEVCSRSPAFTFSAPKPLEDLVTLEEEPNAEGEGNDMLLVVPRAELLQSRLQECLHERSELLQLQDATNQLRERDKEEYKKAKQSWDRQCSDFEMEIARLQGEREQAQDKLDEMKEQQKKETALAESLLQEKSALLEAKDMCEQRIRELEDDFKMLTDRAVEREIELERMKERSRRAGLQKKEEESEKINLQIKLEQAEAELRSLSKEFQGLRNSLAQRDTSILQLQNTISTLTQKLSTAHRKEAESEAAIKEMRSLRERLALSERTAEGLRNDLSAMVTQRDLGQAELHQARLQAAQLTLQLADFSLALREGRAQWAHEKQSLQRNSEKDHERIEKLHEEMQKMEEALQEEKMEKVKLEVELGRERDCNRVQLNETRRELQELKTSLRVTQKEKEQLQAEKKDLMEYICQLEQKMGAVTTVTGAKWSASLLSSVAMDSLSDSEDENPEALQPLSAPLGHYSLCEHGQPEALLLNTPPQSPRDSERSAVVINQPAPLCSPRQTGSDALAHSSDSEDETERLQCLRRSSGEDMDLLLPDHADFLLSDLADTALW